jgi:tetratricopeptide (TPR) repeat protein
MLEELFERVRGLDPEAGLLCLEAEPDEQSDLWHYVHGSLLRRLGRLKEAVTAAEKSCALQPEIGEYRANLGAGLLAQAMEHGPEAGADAFYLKSAIAELERAVSLEPLLVDGLASLGLAYQLAGRNTEALVVLDSAVDHDPNHLAAWYNRASVLRELDRKEDCLHCLEQALRIDPQFEPAKISRQRIVTQRSGSE